VDVVETDLKRFKNMPTVLQLSSAARQKLIIYFINYPEAQLRLRLRWDNDLRFNQWLVSRPMVMTASTSDLRPPYWTVPLGSLISELSEALNDHLQRHPSKSDLMVVLFLPNGQIEGLPASLGTHWSQPWMCWRP
jgi:hypothetical protein